MDFVLTCGSDPEVKQGKPSPDPYLIAAQKFKNGPVVPEKCLAFEDSPLGVESATLAGMQCVMVGDARLPDTLTRKSTQFLLS